MIQQTQQSDGATRAIAPLRTLAELGDEGVRRVVETDLTPRSTFPVDPRWYEKYWYGDRSPSKWGLPATALRRVCCEAPLVSDSIVRAIERTASALVRLCRSHQKSADLW